MFRHVEYRFTVRKGESMERQSLGENGLFQLTQLSRGISE